LTEHRSLLVTDRAHLRKLLARLDDPDVRDVFVVAGDVGQPAGEFEGAAPPLAATSPT
jgi:hypothetical protein